jgi:hypothetical protein
MIEMGWREEGECLVLPAGKSLTMREVRDIDDARAALKKREEEEFKRRIAARNKAKQEGSARGRLIYAIDYTHEMGPALIALVDEMLKCFGAVRRIGPAPRGPLERDAAKLLAGLSGK